MFLDKTSGELVNDDETLSLAEDKSEDTNQAQSNNDKIKLVVTRCSLEQEIIPPT